MSRSRPGGPFTSRISRRSGFWSSATRSRKVWSWRATNGKSRLYSIPSNRSRASSRSRGRTPGGRRTILQHIGNALLVQHRVLGRVAVTEKPDVLWDRPDLERLYSRLEGEYELKERAGALDRKLGVTAETATVLTDIIDTERSRRLELIIDRLTAIWPPRNPSSTTTPAVRSITGIE
jgi:hypothetical protein